MSSAYVAARERAASHLNTLLGYAKKCKNQSNSDIVAALQNVEDNFNIYKDAHAEVLSVTGSAEIDFQESLITNVQDTYTKAKTLLKQALSTRDLGESSQSNQNHDESIMTKTTKSGKLLDALEHQIRTLSVKVRQEDPNKVTKGLISTRINLLTTYWNNFQQNYYQHLSLESNLNETLQESQFEAVEQCFTETMGELNDQNDRFGNSTNNSTPTHQRDSAPRSLANIHLPSINLPQFSGKYVDWISFRDMFMTMIIENTSLSDVQRLHYLKCSLKGEAESLVKNIAITSNNFQVAWDLLIHQYENERIIVNFHLQSLMALPTVKNNQAKELKTLLNGTREAIRALQILGRPTDYWSDWLTFITSQKLDTDTRERWESSISESKDIPTFEVLCKFVEGRVVALESMSMMSNKTSHRTSSSTNVKVFHTPTTSSSCTYCKEKHFISFCNQYQNISVDLRRKFAKEKSLCYNCLSEAHSRGKCKSKFKCKKCRKSHHTLLHDEQFNVGTSSTQETVSTFACNNTKLHDTAILLATAQIKVTDTNGKSLIVRALIDQGSQSSFITESLAKILQRSSHPINVPIQGIGGIRTQTAKEMVEIIGSSLIHKDYKVIIQAIVMKKLTGILPSVGIQTNERNWPHVRTLDLADPTYFKPGSIDILLGADVYAEILLNGLVKGKSGEPICQKTWLGWIISGPTNVHKATDSNELLTLHTVVNEDDQLKKFWEIEEVSTSRLFTKEETHCEEHFHTTHRRDSTGRFVVRLPFKTEDNLGESRKMAVSTLLHMEKRFESDLKLKQMYIEFMDEYLTLNHMEKIPQIGAIKDQCFYLPHHAVLKPSSSTTKLRVVFDASRKTSNKISLNDKLAVGPTLQQPLATILIRWRKYKVVYSADVTKMYRQIYVHKDDQDFQRIVWRKSSSEPIMDYRLKTATYGTSSAPYLAIKALRQLALDEAENYPIASEICLRDFYVDDVMSGADTISQAVHHQNELLEMLSKGGFELRKWASNRNEILQNVPLQDREIHGPLELKLEETVKALGIHWNPSSDQFGFKVSLPEASVNPTKRELLSDVSRFFDPLGWLAPSLLIGKLMFQKLWLLGISWDDVLPDELAKKWLQYRQDVKNLERIVIPRWLGSTTHSTQIELHGFCDASNDAYAAAVYARILQGDGTYMVQLISAKTRIAPIKRISIPRLELCGAVLVAKLLKTIQLALNEQDLTIFAWTDSKIVLAWLQGNSHNWKTFVANRITEIQTTIANNQWNHIASKDNPADVASRGINPSDLKDHQLWWTGPPWLKNPNDQWPINHQKVFDTTLERRISNVVTMNVKVESRWELLHRYNDLKKLLRITAICKRVFKRDSWKPYISRKELDIALTFWIRSTQQIAFNTEKESLVRDGEITGSSKIKTLHPFIDNDGIIRVGGRLQNSNLRFQLKHAIILPQSDPLTKMLIADAHYRTLHGGVQDTMTYLRNKYWIINMRNEVRHYIHKCMICFRHKTETQKQLMGSLPAARVNPSVAFLHTGVDFAGPLTLKPCKGRGRTTYKTYIALFICFATRAIHLELVSDLTADAFVASFKRFVARRGICSDIYSDCGTNFVKANKLLKNDHEKSMAIAASAAREKLNDIGTEWHFNPPSAPHFGGLWEAGVKSTKFHLKRVLSNNILTYEEMLTILVQIEGILNSRPLCPLNNDCNDLEILTPGHFLVGRNIMAPPEPNLLQVPDNRVSRWKLLQKLYQDFWKRWSTEYLSRLQQRPKWLMTQPNLQIGELVLIKDDNQYPSNWPLGRITEIHAGSDGLVRVVTVKTKNTYIKRPVAKLCKLPSQ